MDPESYRNGSWVPTHGLLMGQSQLFCHTDVPSSIVTGSAAELAKDLAAAALRFFAADPALPFQDDVVHRDVLSLNDGVNQW